MKDKILLVLLVVLISCAKVENKVCFKDKCFNVEIADNDEERSQGLSGQEKLVYDHGLLFIFPEASEYGFWMKQMNFAIDIIWINGNTIVDIKENLQPVNWDTPDSELTIYYPQKPADKVLELLNGTCQKYNIKIGDRVEL